MGSQTIEILPSLQLGAEGGNNASYVCVSTRVSTLVNELCFRWQQCTACACCCHVTSNILPQI
jgi:hypothetical protein